MTSTVTTNTMEDLGGQYLSFRLEGQEYGIPIACVREIIGAIAITRVPHAPPWIRGVINLRGKIIPVADLRVRFALPPAAVGEPCIIVVRTTESDVGILVDVVSEVVRVNVADVAPLPEMAAGPRTACLRAIHKTPSLVRFLLDVPRALPSLASPDEHGAPAWR
jgi:purine-binding chemotaxis protein CheW